MPLTVAVVGSDDRPLLQLLRSRGFRTEVVDIDRISGVYPVGAKGPDVFIVDIRALAGVPRELGALKRHFPTSAVIIVARTLDPAAMLEAMRHGVGEWMTEPLEPMELDAAIHRVARPVARGPAGKTFAVMGAKGGVGSTTVAVNLATGLAKASRQQTLFIDLHLAHGDAAVFFGVEPRFSVLDALENIHRLDETYFKGLVVSTKAGPDLLASSDRGLVSAVEASRVRDLVEFASTVYRYVVLDCPRADGAITEALDAASTVVVLANQELSTLRNATRLAAALRQRCGPNRVKLAISRLDAHSEISQQDVERVLGGPVTYAFPSDYRTSLTALNRGEPLILQNHSALAGSFERFVYDLAELERPTDSSRARSGIFGRLGSRR